VKNDNGKFKIYETFVDSTDTNKTFVIEIDNCVGSTEVFVAKSFSDLIESKIEMKSS